MASAISQRLLRVTFGNTMIFAGSAASARACLGGASARSAQRGRNVKIVAIGEFHMPLAWRLPGAGGRLNGRTRPQRQPSASIHVS